MKRRYKKRMDGKGRIGGDVEEMEEENKRTIEEGDWICSWGRWDMVPCCEAMTKTQD
jgi:hypothetical protein